jgi:hypothetical protein
VRDDEAEPDDEDDGEREAGHHQPSRGPHAMLHARHDVRPAPETIFVDFKMDQDLTSLRLYIFEEQRSLFMLQGKKAIIFTYLQKINII